MTAFTREDLAMQRTMQAVVHGVSDQDLEALAQYVANLN